MSPRLLALLAVCAPFVACDEAPGEKTEKAEKREQSGPEVAATAALTATPTVKSRPEKEKDSKRRPKSILLAEAREVVGWRVADGFLEKDEIVKLAMASADGRESLRSEIEALVDEELSAHRKREAAWKYLTVPDRLSRAFAALDKQGVIARERFTDCRKCGVTEMKVLREDLLDQGKRAEGYVFFTDQDADGVSESGELVLEYGSFREGDEAAAKVGAKVEAALKAEGLTPVAETDDAEAYFVLSGLDWQKRRFTRPPR